MFGEGGVPYGVAVVGIAKGPDRNAGRETFFVAGRDAFKLPDRDPALYFVQRLRDEAHRFAIGTHRARRKKDFTRIRWTRSPASARPASAPCCTPSAPPRRSAGRPWPTSRRCRG